MLRVALVVLCAACRYEFEPIALSDGMTDDAPQSDAPIDAGPDAAVVCPAGYTTIGGLPSRYRVAASTDTWAAAEQACEAEGTHLAIPDDTVEMVELYLAQSSQAYWAGISDRRAVGTWLTVTGATASFLLWQNSEPDEQLPECVQTTNQGMEDRDCESGRSYVCECDGRVADPTSY